MKAKGCAFNPELYTFSNAGFNAQNLTKCWRGDKQADEDEEGDS